MKLLSFLLYFLPVLIEAQVAGKACLTPPLQYLNPTGEIAPSSAPAVPKKPNSEWYVFSDRANNPTYEKSDGATEKARMGFLEVFVVIEQTDDYVHVARIQNTGDIDPSSLKLKSTATDYGWAPKSRMLLWSNALVEPQNKFTIKALTINSVEALNDVGKYADDEKLKIYSDPGLRALTDNDVRLYDFLYIFKKEGNSFLIGKTNIVRLPLGVSKVILGWVDKGIITEWKQRLVLEPNTSKAAAADRKAKGVKPALFATLSDVEQYRTDGVTDSRALMAQDPGEVVPMPHVKRLPIINQLEGGIVKTGFVTGVYDIYNTEVIKSEEQAEIERAFNATRDKYRNVNIVFVVDGSEIMRDYKAAVYDLVYNQVLACQNREDNSEDPNKFKLGAVVYRDISEKNCAGDGDRSLEKRALTTDYQQVLNFMNGMMFRSCNDKDYYQMMYQGVESACRMFDQNQCEDNTNIIILVGSGGNRESEASLKPRLIEMFTKYQVSFMAFQVKNNGNDAQTMFSDQVKDLMVESTYQIRKKMNEKWSMTRVDLKKKSFSSSYGEGGIKYRLLCPQSSPIPGTLIFADKDNPVPPDSLNAEVNYIVKSFLEVKEDVLSGLDSKLKGIGKRSVVNEAMYLFLSNMKVDVDLLRRSSSQNIQFFVDAYTSMSCDKLSYPLYRYCVFMDQRELQELSVSLGKIFNQDVDASALRGYVRDALRQTVISYFGNDRAKKLMRTKTAEEVMRMMTGLPSCSPVFKKFTVDDFADTKKVSDLELSKIMQEMNEKLDKLNTMPANPAYYFRSNDNSYYWIPQDLLP